MSHFGMQVSRTVLALSIAAVLAACGSEPQAQATSAPPPPSVGVVVTERANVPMVAELPGRTAPFLIAELRPQVTGIIKQRTFVEGAEVKAGDLLYQIDPATYQAAYDNAKAVLARAEANLNSAKLTAQRYAGLAKIDAVSQQANDDAIAALKLAEADVAAAKAAQEQARIDLAFTRVTSPIDGRIGRSTVTAGALVIANQAQALATVQQLDPIYVDVTQSSAELLRLRRDIEQGRIQRLEGGNIPVRLVLEDGSDYTEIGQLAFSEVSVDPNTGSVTMRAVFPNPAGELLPGMYVRSRIEQGVKDVVLVPHASVGRDPRGNATVMVVKPDNTVESRIVRTERSLGDKWVVSDGLENGERVIVEGLQKVRPGVTVAPEVVAATTN